MGRKPRVTRDQIVGAARAVFLARGYDATTLAEIASGLDLTAAALLRHFPSKHDLFAAAMHDETAIAPPDCILRLQELDGTEDPREVLRTIAEEFLPFVQKTMAVRLVVSMHERSRGTSLTVPFQRDDPDSAPKRGIRIVAAYLERAAKAGRVQVHDSRAAAMIFMGSLQAYALNHYVLGLRPVHPLPDYIDTLLELWTSGAIVTPYGGAVEQQTKVARKDRHPGTRPARRGSGDRDVPARVEEAEARRPVRDDRSADGERGVARRRPRQPRVRR